MKYFYFLIFFVSSICFGFTKSGFYTVDSDGWKVAELPPEIHTEVFRCIDCNGQVQIQISFGPLGAEKAYKSTENLIGLLKTKQSFNEFIMTIVEESTPGLTRNDVSILNENKNSSLGGFPAIEFSFVGKNNYIKSTVEQSYISIRKDRFLRISINYYLDEEKLIKKDKINAFINSFKYL